MASLIPDIRCPPAGSNGINTPVGLGPTKKQWKQEEKKRRRALVRFSAARSPARARTSLRLCKVCCLTEKALRCSINRVLCIRNGPRYYIRG